MAQEYPRELVEVIVIDNGSTDRTKDVVREFPVTLLEDATAKNAYTARNAGIRKATGEIVALTDADCIIDPKWIAASVQALEDEHADMVGGNIRFTFPRGMTAGAIVDSLVNLRNDKRASTRGRAVTANLVVKASLFRTLGLFPDGDPMAGDIVWTANASARGFKMVYGAAAIVHHPARGFSGLLKKTFVLARAYAYQQRGLLKPDLGKGTVWRLLLGYLPPNPRWVWKSMRQRLGGDLWRASPACGVSSTCTLCCGPPAVSSVSPRTHGRSIRRRHVPVGVTPRSGNRVASYRRAAWVRGSSVPRAIMPLSSS